MSIECSSKVTESGAKDNNSRHYFGEKKNNKEESLVKLRIKRGNLGLKITNDGINFFIENKYGFLGYH